MKNVRRSIHPLEEGTGAEASERADGKTAENADENGRMYGFLHAFVVVCTVVMCDRDGRTDGQTHEHIQNQVDESTDRADRRQRLGTEELAHDKGICRSFRQTARQRRCPPRCREAVRSRSASAGQYSGRSAPSGSVLLFVSLFHS